MKSSQNRISFGGGVGQKHGLNFAHYYYFAGRVGRIVDKPTDPLPKNLASEAIRLLGSSKLRLTVDGQIPIAGGVSSSSALVVAAAVILSRLLGIRMSRKVRGVTSVL